MALAKDTFEYSYPPPAASSLELFQRQPPFDPNDVQALIRDFFTWFEDEWKQPVIQASWPSRDELLSQIAFPPRLEEEGVYSKTDLASLVGYYPEYVIDALRKAGIRPACRRSRRYRGGSTPYLYLGRDCMKIVEKWKRENLCAALDPLWARFLPKPCGRCPRCSLTVRVSPFECSLTQGNAIKNYRESFNRFLRTLQDYENFEAWWRYEQNGIVACSPRSITSHSGIVLLYLLDRHLLDLSFNDLVDLSFPGIEYQDFLRPWSNRHPEEYQSYLRGLAKIRGRSTRAHAILSFIFMKNGIQSITELGRRLSSEDIRQAVREQRLLTPHLYYDIYLDVPLSDDIRVGHVALDELRYYFWSYARDRIQEDQPANQIEGSVACWNWGPRKLQICQIMAVERILTAKIWFGAQTILPLRPETEGPLTNPHLARRRSEAGGAALHWLPETFQTILATYISYRFHEQHISLHTLSSILRTVIPFLYWAHDHAELHSCALWDQTKTQAIVGAYLATRYPRVKTTYKYKEIWRLYHFFHILAQIDLSHPPGYQAILRLLPPRPETQRSIPAENILDRVFNEGVRQFDYDPFARLALTIQYFCGTRVTETCDLPLFCFLEGAIDDGSRILELVIPRGKTKEERRFPIASVGMGPLLEYMAQVVGMQLAPGGEELPLHAPRANARYLETDTEKALNWDYLFDRSLHPAEHASSHPRVLKSNRVDEALQEALLFAAKKNPRGLFLEETYSRRCTRRRRAGQECRYLAFVDGIIVCPICGGSLPGKRGHCCRRKVKQAFECDGVGREGDYFCPKCDGPLAELVPIKTHTFRHNSVTRAHRYGMPLAQNMKLHGHKTIPMHFAYLHLLPQDQQDAITRVFSEKFLQDIRLASSYAPGQVIVEGIAQTPTYEQLLELTLCQGLSRGTDGLWGGFWTGALAEEGVVSPIRRRAQIILTEETYHHAVAQYRFEALSLAVSEVALECGTKGKFRATVAPFLERQEIERLVSNHLGYIQQGYLNTVRGVRLLEADIQAKSRFLAELAGMLQPWVQRYGLESIDRLVMELDPGTDGFQKRRGGGTDALDQELPTAESES